MSNHLFVSVIAISLLCIGLSCKSSGDNSENSNNAAACSALPVSCQAHLNTVESDCDFSTQGTEGRLFVIEQDGCSAEIVSIMDSFDCEIRGDNITCAGYTKEHGGTARQTMEGQVESDRLVGRSSWTWESSDTGSQSRTCSGTTTIECEPSEVDDEQPQCISDKGCPDGMTCIPSGPLCFKEIGCCVSAGGDNEPCFEDASCDRGFTCVEEHSACEPGLEHCCLSAGHETQPCYEDGSCEAGLFCVKDDKLCLSIGTCCVPAGGKRQSCYPDNTCDQGLFCIENLFICNDLDSCCAEAGGEYEPCYPDGTCDGDLSCEVDVLLRCGTADPCCLRMTDTD